jgi:cell wall-associated NlpC family hydrolase
LKTRTLVPCLLVLSATLSLTNHALAQSSETENKTTNATRTNPPRLETEPKILPPLEESQPRAVTSPASDQPVPTPPAINTEAIFDRQLLVAIQNHLGAAYRFNRTGPDFFDCSGLVWRAFQDVGVNFQRGPARSYWATFEAPPSDERFKFGTLVFFSNLGHVGIVVDEKGFYHSARHGGVMYSPFNDYWLSRIDGFRRVPVEMLMAKSAEEKPRLVKPTVLVRPVRPPVPPPVQPNDQR